MSDKNKLNPDFKTTVYSEYLNCPIEVKAYAGKDNPDQIIILHDSLKDVFYNKIPQLKPSDLNIKHERKLVFGVETGPTSGMGHFAYSYRIWDNYDRDIYEVGETTAKTANDEIGKNIPIMLAYQRAFDRAVIAYLALPGKCFGSAEGVEYDKNSPIITEEFNHILPEEFDILDDNNIADIQESILPSPVVSKNNEVEDKPATMTDEAKKEDIPNIPCEEVMVNIGQYIKDPKPIKEVWASNPSFISWIKNKYNKKDALKAAVVEFLKKEGVGK